MLKVFITLILLSQPALAIDFMGYANRRSQLNRRDISGYGTYFTPYQDACSKNGESSSEFEMIAASSRFEIGLKTGENTEQAAMCGKCIKVQGPKGSVIVKIRDICPSCRRGDIDLTEAAFKKIADPDQGRVKVTWKRTKC
ncbi:hypothetical protein K7432_008583 [Basidiobolus ranarum]|uniref:Expansin-like EG45 domain-containing protein n=1 Tax=Basidiobolus ranarum TaxID=34480 RepID=A0ABR2VYV4_9FUNG